MKLLKTIRQFIFTDFSVIIIPKTTKSPKQFKLNALAIYSIVASLLVLLIFLAASLIFFYNGYKNLVSDNTYLVSEISSIKYSKVASDDLNKNLEETIGKLEVENEDNLDYLNGRIGEVNGLITEVSNVISTFNTENNTDLTVPISRSLDRASVQDLTSFRNIDDKLAEMDIEEIKEQDALSQIVYSMKEESSSLISEIEDELEYLDCLPDLPPIEGRLSSSFGYRRHPITGLRSFHYGIDLTASRGTPVQVAGSGVVVFSGWRGGFGKVIIVSHGYGYETVYAHNNEIYAVVGDTVNKGDVISAVGNTGNSTGPHLHFEIRLDGEAIDPTGVLRYDR